ncbi:MAG: recombinase RecT, partial [Actinomycetota bacterium]|nr:recombinase RecT [Actinomycetota bacterium]
MSTALEPRDAARDLANTIRGDEFKTQVQLALPEGMRPERFVRIMATALLDKPEIAVQCDINSIFQAGLKAAQDGLLPDGREAAFAIFGDQCVYMPMVGGFRKIAAEYGWSLRSAVVYANDAFEYEEGLEPRLVHRPVRPGAEQGAKIAAYAVAEHKDGRRLFEVMDAAAVAKRKAVARTKKVWDQWEETMWEKTPTRRLFGKLPFDEADRARIERVLSAAELGPEGSARALYGDGREDTRVHLPQIPPGPDPGPVDAEA